MSRWPKHNLLFWERAPFFRLLSPLAVGIYIYYCLGGSFFPATVPLVISAICLAIAAMLLGISKPLSRLFFLLFQAGVFAIGVAAAALGDERNNEHWFGHEVKSGNAWLVVVKAAPRQREHSWKIAVDVIGRCDTRAVTPTCGSALIYLYKDNMPVLYHVGDTLLVPAGWLPIANRGNPGEFDYARYCNLKNYYYQLTCSAEAIRTYSTIDPKAQALPLQIRQWCNRTLATFVPDRTTGGFLQAMLTGDDLNLDDNLREVFVATGIVHIIVISGGNIMLVFGLVSLLLRFIRHNKYNWLKYLLALPVIALYVLVAGADASPVRAMIMFAIVAFGLVLQKSANALNQLFATAFLMLLIAPYWLLTIGFQLSFIAVLSLLLFQRPIESVLRVKNKVLQKLWSSVVASVAAELLIAPFVVYYFHNFPLVFIISNVLAAIFIVVELYGALLILALSWWPAVASLCGWVIVWFNMFFVFVLKALQWANPASLGRLYLSLPEMVLVYSAIALLALWIASGRAYRLLLAMMCMLLLLVSQCCRDWVNGRARHLVVYNVSHGMYCEWVTGRSYTTVAADSAGTASATVAVKEAHMLWGTSPNETLPDGQISWLLGGQHIALLPKSVPVSGHFPVDVLILQEPGTYNAQTLQQVYHPSLIVMGNNFTTAEKERWVRDCERTHIQLHITGRDGAWVVEER